MRIEIREARDDEFYRIVELAPDIKEETRYSSYDLNIKKLQSYYDMQSSGNFKYSSRCIPKKTYIILSDLVPTIFTRTTSRTF